MRQLCLVRHLKTRNISRLTRLLIKNTQCIGINIGISLLSKTRLITYKLISLLLLFVFLILIKHILNLFSIAVSKQDHIYFLADIRIKTLVWWTIFAMYVFIHLKKTTLKTKWHPVWGATQPQIPQTRNKANQTENLHKL